MNTVPSVTQFAPLAALTVALVVAAVGAAATSGPPNLDTCGSICTDPNSETCRSCRKRQTADVTQQKGLCVQLCKDKKDTSPRCQACREAHKKGDKGQGSSVLEKLISKKA